jgi:hypothetical protein
MKRLFSEAKSEAVEEGQPKKLPFVFRDPTNR